ncbi:SOS-response transcriptional repressor LexA [Caulobacter sp. BE264]|uniref:LexA family protein n=1 Tax=Caulobacter sp. BE264 TaxID=2817724 RepID=UPI002856915F|nr:S24 family peptidase [Caulobacter sp. BE264]MDR7232797.1 SOS-response transcriptional repressor LexA [Caulobacter sp. BE264]
MPTEIDKTRENVRRALDEASVDPVPLAIKLGKGRDYITDFLKGRKQKLPIEVLADIAAHTGYASADHLRRGIKDAAVDRDAAFLSLKASHAPKGSLASPPVSVVPPIKDIARRIPVVGDVQAGVWLEAVARETYEVEEYLALDVAGYESARLRAMRVVGPSMNKVYAPGRFVVLADPAEAGLQPGDHVVIERRKDTLTEITLKEYVEEPDGRIAFWPRSDHPDFQEPIYLRSRDEIDQDGVSVIGVVVADYGRRYRTGG